jgi:hypothetical protein
MRNSLKGISRAFDAVVLGSPVVPIILVVMVLLSLAI